MRAAAEAEFHDYAVSAMPSLLRTAFLITGDRHDAEDLVQAALARTYAAWPKIRDARAIDAYIRRAMLNAHISGWRRARRIRFSALESSAETAAPGTEAHMGAVELRGVLFPALKRLTARQRAVLVLRFYEDRSEAEVAELLGVSQGTIKSTTSDALRRLRTDPDIAAYPRVDTSEAGARACS